MPPHPLLLPLLQTRSAATLSWPVAICVCANSTLWILYGIALQDPFVWAPNTAGALIGVLSLLLIGTYGERSARHGLAAASAASPGRAPSPVSLHPYNNLHVRHSGEGGEEEVSHSGGDETDYSSASAKAESPLRGGANGTSSFSKGGGIGGSSAGASVTLDPTPYGSQALQIRPGPGAGDVELGRVAPLPAPGRF